MGCCTSYYYDQRKGVVSSIQVRIFTVNKEKMQSYCLTNEEIEIICTALYALQEDLDTEEDISVDDVQEILDTIHDQTPNQL